MKAIICGAGIAGLSLAWWLEHIGWQVVVVEHARGRRGEGYMIDFFGAGYGVTERMGLEPMLAEAQTDITAVHYVRPDGRPLGVLDYGAFAKLVDSRAHTLLRGDLERILHHAVRGRVSVRYGTTVDQVSDLDPGVKVTLSDGSVHAVDLLVGADGIHSRIRKLVFGDHAASARYLGFHTAAYLLDDADLLGRVGSKFLVVAAPHRQVGLYPTGDGRMAVWLVHPSAEAAIPDAPAETIRAAYAGMGPLVDRALIHVPDGEGLYYDQVTQIEMSGWSRGSVTLVGDACQAVSLMAGQGASLAVAGGFVLADELGRGGPVPDAVDRYEQRMRPLVTGAQRQGRRTVKWLVPDSWWRLRLRAIGFAAVSLPGVAAVLRRGVNPWRRSVV